MGRTVINETENKQTVILNDSPEGVEGGFFDSLMEWHDLTEGQDSPAVYVGKTFKIKASPEAAVGSSYTYIPVFCTWNGETGARKYGVYLTAYATKQLKIQFVNQYLASPPAADTLIDANGDKTTGGESFECTLPCGLAAEFKEMFDKVFEEVTE